METGLEWELFNWEDKSNIRRMMVRVASSTNIMIRQLDGSHANENKCCDRAFQSIVRELNVRKNHIYIYIILFLD